MDNVDRLNLENQLAAFQLTLWFLQLTHAFTILQMRDETYERFKDKPPLDTFRTGVVFHITPPRFVDVVKRRLELSIEYLASHKDRDRSYEIEAGCAFVTAARNWKVSSTVCTIHYLIVDGISPECSKRSPEGCPSRP